MSSRRFVMLRLAVAAVGLLVCGWMTWHAGRAGLSRLLSIYGDNAGELAAVEIAVRLGPSDPRAHIARAAVLSDSDRWSAAVDEYEQAAALRPHDFTLWLALGQAREQAGDAGGAVKAVKEAVRLAPYYAQPRWQLGNMLLRTGDYDQAFIELRRAAESNPALLQQIIDLADGLYGGDVEAVLHALQPQSSAARITLARFFARRGRTGAAVQMFRAVDSISDQDRRMLLTELLAAEQFLEAFEVWASGRHPDRDHREGNSPETVTDGGFEGEVYPDDPGFEWQVMRNVRAVKASLDTRQPHTGSNSLRIDWTGDSQPFLPVVIQRVLVKPGENYVLKFWARSENLVTGGVPAVVIVDAGRDRSPLSPLLPLALVAGEWQKYSIKFAAKKTTRAILISILRQNCGVTQCPIFGQTWFDDFEITLSNPEFTGRRIEKGN